MTDNGHGVPPTAAVDLLGPVRTSSRGNRWRTQVEVVCHHVRSAVNEYGNRTAYCKDCGASRGTGGLWLRLLDVDA